MARESQRCQARLSHDNAKLLFQFSDQRFLGPFAGLDLASGKFPQACHRFAGGALGEQHAAVGIDEGTGGDKNKFDAHWPRPELGQSMVKSVSTQYDTMRLRGPVSKAYRQLGPFMSDSRR
jgi:hypothetical protein